MIRTMEGVKARGRLLAVAVVALVLAGCAQTEADFDECEPGVEGISQLGDITAAGC